MSNSRRNLGGDTQFDDELKRRGSTLTTTLQQRDSEWRKELVARDRALRIDFREREQAFINEQLKRDHELLKILEVREKEMEHNLLQKAYAFGYLYKEHQKKIKAMIQKRDEELKATLNFREKLWIEAWMVNANLLKMYNAQGEFEGALNSVGSRQNELIKQTDLMQEWYFLNKGDSSTVKSQPLISDFTPSNASYKYEPINLKSYKSYRKRK